MKSRSRWVALVVVAAVGGLVGLNVASASSTATPEQTLQQAALDYARSQGWTPPSPSPSPTVSPSPTPSPTPSATSSGQCPAAGQDKPGAADPWGGCFPGPGNTGVPAGTPLTAYSGALTGTLTGKRLTGDLAVSGNLTLVNSEIDGTIRTTGSGTLHLTDVTINGGTSGTETYIDLQGANITAVRIDLYGGNSGFSCSDNCSVTDSWLHDPYVIGAKHYDTVGSNGVNGFTITHNSMWCSNHSHAAGATGGCTADAGFFGDFSTIDNVHGTRNLFVASNDSAGYCLNGGWGQTGKPFPNGTHLSWTSNVFQKGANGRCGQYGPVDYWGGEPSNVWTGNTWDDGTPLNE